MVTVTRQLVGAWVLVDWQTRIDDADRGNPFGDGTGFLQYGADGWMSAILCAAGRPNVDAPMLALASADEIEASARQYVSYAGRWELDDDVVHHHVAFSLLPNWIGTTLVRNVSWRDDRLVLTTPAHLSPTGKQVVEQLTWRRAIEAGNP